jgi:hypothetical protein
LPLDLSRHHHGRGAGGIECVSGAISEFGLFSCSDLTAGASGSASSASGRAFGSGTLMIAGFISCPESSCRRFFASSRQCSLSQRSSRNASWTIDNARRNPSISARSAAVSGLLVLAEGRINRKIVDFAPPASRAAVSDVSAMGLLRVMANAPREPRRQWFTNPYRRGSGCSLPDRPLRPPSTSWC